MAIPDFVCAMLGGELQVCKVLCVEQETSEQVRCFVDDLVLVLPENSSEEPVKQRAIGKVMLERDALFLH